MTMFFDPVGTNLAWEVMKLLHSKRSDMGLVFNIQRFSVHDGPGIRTTVFMKGCPLRCLWCSNPESQGFSPTLMVRDINCKGCGACSKACPRGAICIHEHQRTIDRNKCNDCFNCVEFCIYRSLSVCGRYMSSPDILEEILKDKAFYENSGGGVTVSGGEPLSQGDFVADLFALCRNAGLNTVLDTTGYAPWETMKAVIEFADLILFDIKHLDREAHKKTTGVDNHLILQNLKRAADYARIWLRIPLIAGFNDSEEHVRAITRLGRRYRVEKISLLPYHEGGKTKCEQIGGAYSFPGNSPPDDAHLIRLKQIIEHEGLKCDVGT